MARRGHRQKNGLNLHSPSDRKGVSSHGLSPLTNQQDRGNVNGEEMDSGEELSNGSYSVPPTKSTTEINHSQDGGSRKKYRESQRKDRKTTGGKSASSDAPYNGNPELGKNGMSTSESPDIRDGTELPHVPPIDHTNDDLGNLSDGLHRHTLDETHFPETVVFKFIRTGAISVARSFANWVQRHKPTFVSVTSNIVKACNYVQMKIQKAQPIIFRLITHIGGVMLLLFMVWLDCAVRGIDSFLRMGTTSFFSILWCSVLSVIAMAGFNKVLCTLAVAAAVGFFLGFLPAFLLIGLVGMLFLWFYGSFWTTGLIIFLGGLTFMMAHDRIALFITSAYALYCAWNYVGWLGLVVGMNLSFVSSDALLFFLRNIISERGAPNSSSEQAAGVQGQQPSPNQSNHSSPMEKGATGLPDRSQGVPSTSGIDSEMTSEDEVVRLLNCSDHYAALGLSRFENVDLSVIKRDYRKKAMLVHPDKNMGNEKAAEAFKRLQNAYEVLLDSTKRKEYDDELRREELLNYFRKFHNSSNKHKGHSLFQSSFGHPEADADDLMGESRRIACRKCGSFHLWVYTKKAKSRARWCQECKDFHQAKDGDGWVEQGSKPLFFGILQQVEAPSAYVCADGKIYDASEWYICQGLRCPANAHKPSFHVNTSVVSKNGRAKGASFGQRGGAAPNPEETMMEEELFEWLRNATQSSTSENFGGSTSETSPGFDFKSSGGGGGGSGSSNNSKRKKKGKKHW
ncbi:uncharacterized protein LOC127249239 [Andrographis paniculata]|uniref:uncharacterized protein LOC127249239 n=1 Tax=Andrographis paniculata TaxID=175694 RepID=UPI0021E82110|nr:uncharacterized protein LOC127249239 [Andrographis paniculata]XP_051127912.1 uncharacterized protein LOC127249239 [Andrographis paniculata]XP_051127913.1 uncharacterized protein LOC127249239 [Andrographis paniculata]XP_051127914.1 uncharacterized protein LOC127249239 [Andrographis paniculata]